MGQHYSDPERETMPHALPDIECFYLSSKEAAGLLIENESTLAYDLAADRGQRFDNVKHMTWFQDALAKEVGGGWFYWYCLPGCLPDSEAIGPFVTEADALDDARS